MRATDVSAYPWRSASVFAAELDGRGTIRRANPAMEELAGRPLEGTPLEDLLVREQVRALSRSLSAAGETWGCSTFAFCVPGGGAAQDRTVWLRRAGDDLVELVAEPGWPERDRLVEQVLELNDDLISTQRSLTRRQREVELAQEQGARAAARVGQLERLLMAGLSSGDFDTSLAALLGRVLELLPGQRADILLVEETGERLVVRATQGKSDPPAWSVRVGDGLTGGIALTGASLLVEDLANSRSIIPGLHGSMIGTPLRNEGQVMGVLLVTAEEPRSFGQSDLRLLELAGERVALAVGQAQLRDREQRLAETLQRTLLPQALPDVPGLAVAARYHAQEGTVGGDFYDAMVLPDGRVGLAIADVTGKGLQAAATMSRLRGALHAYALDSSTPSQVLDRLDRLAEAEGALATALYLAIQPATGAMSLTSAGHHPPLLIEGGRVRFLDLAAGLSPMLGLGAGGRRELRLMVSPGATLVLFTDGLVERTHDLDAGLRELREAAVTLGDRDLDALCAELLLALSPSGRYRDDVAVLALRRTA